MRDDGGAERPLFISPSSFSSSSSSSSKDPHLPQNSKARKVQNYSSWKMIKIIITKKKKVTLVCVSLPGPCFLWCSEKEKKRNKRTESSRTAAGEGKEKVAEANKKTSLLHLENPPRPAQNSPRSRLLFLSPTSLPFLRHDWFIVCIYIYV